MTSLRNLARLALIVMALPLVACSASDGDAASSNGLIRIYGMDRDRRLLAQGADVRHHPLGGRLDHAAHGLGGELQFALRDVHTDILAPLRRAFPPVSPQRAGAVRDPALRRSGTDVA